MTDDSKHALEIGGVLAGLLVLWLLWRSSPAQSQVIAPNPPDTTGAGDYSPSSLTFAYPQQYEQIPVGNGASISGVPAGFSNPLGAAAPITIGGENIVGPTDILGGSTYGAPVFNYPGINNGAGKHGRGCSCCSTGSTQGNASPSLYVLGSTYSNALNSVQSSYPADVVTAATYGGYTNSVPSSNTGSSYLTGLNSAGIPTTSVRGSSGFLTSENI